MPRLTCLLLFLPAALCAQQFTFATYQGGSGDESAAGIVRDSLGNLYLAGSTTSTNFPSSSTAGGGFVVKFDSNGNLLASTLIPGASIAAIAFDTTHNLLVIGGATSPGNGFVSELNPALTQTLWTSKFAASPTALAIDTTGIYVTGYAVAGLITTSAAFQPLNGGPAGTYNAFVLKLSADGSTTLYATYLGGSTYDAAYAIAVDSTGDVYITGVTASSNFPLANAAQKQFGGLLTYFGDMYGDAFVAKLDPKGASLLYSTYLGGAAADEGTAIAVDANGNAFVAGGTQSASWLASPATGTYQTTYAGPTADPNSPEAVGDAFLAKLSSAGALDWYTYLGGAGEDEATALALDSSGNIYVAGNNGSTNFPQTGNPVPDCHLGSRPFLAEFNSTGAKLLLTTGMSGMGYDQAYSLAFDAAHNVAYLAGSVESQVFFATPGAAQPAFGGGDNDSFLARIDVTLQSALAVSCVVNGASFMAGNTSPYPTGAVAPGEIVTLFGAGLGPNPPAGLQLTNSGTVSSSIGGMTVLFDGLPSPLLYASNGQINAVVPYGINASTTNMTVKTASLTAGPIAMPVESSVPAIFMCGAYCNDPSQAAALNSDYSINTVANPAARGDYITFYLAGAGLMSNLTDGAVNAAPLAMPVGPVTVTIRGVNSQVQYAGAAPAYVNGLLQINVYIPTTIDFGDHVPLSVTIGNYSTQDNVTIAVK